MRLRAAASALFPLAGEEKKSKIEAERHRLDSVALTARARQRPQRDPKQRPRAATGRTASRQRRCLALADHAPADRQTQDAHGDCVHENRATSSLIAPAIRAAASARRTARAGAPRPDLSDDAEVRDRGSSATTRALWLGSDSGVVAACETLAVRSAQKQRDMR